MAMLDLKARVLHGKSFHVLRGPILIPIRLVIIAITMTRSGRRTETTLGQIPCSGRQSRRGDSNPGPLHYE